MFFLFVSETSNIKSMIKSEYLTTAMLHNHITVTGSVVAESGDLAAWLRRGNHKRPTFSCSLNTDCRRWTGPSFLHWNSRWRPRRTPWRTARDPARCCFVLSRDSQQCRRHLEKKGGPEDTRPWQAAFPHVVLKTHQIRSLLGLHFKN